MADGTELSKSSQKKSHRAPGLFVLVTVLLFQRSGPPSPQKDNFFDLSTFIYLIINSLIDLWH